ncbi:MAG: cupredoxin domain-containing protein, partial [Actinomycetota bacterium]
SGDSGDSGNGAAVQSITMTATDFEFDPPTITMEPGDVEVTFVNDGDVEHSFTSDELGFDVEAEPGEEASTTFTIPAGDTFPFHCRYHPEQMRGAIYVGGGAGGAGTDTDDDDKDDPGGYDY